MGSLPTGPKGSVAGKFTGSLEHNNFHQGREGSKVQQNEGPAVGGQNKHKNPTKGGGINRATKNNS